METFGSLFRVIYNAYNEKRRDYMKNFVKYALVGLAGYFVGFYEMKYKILKVIAIHTAEKLPEESKTESE